MLSMLRTINGCSVSLFSRNQCTLTNLCPSAIFSFVVRKSIAASVPSHYPNLLDASAFAMLYNGSLQDP